MQTLASMLEHSIFQRPDFTPDEIKRMNREAAEFEQEELRKMIQTRISNANIPRGYINAKADDKDVLAWLQNPEYGLLLQGLPGRGKTYQAVGALMEMAKETTIRFTTFKQIIDECKASFDNATESELSVISRCKNCGCLLIDDMGSERVTEWSLPIIFEIIDGRCANEKPTIITTNYTGEEIMSRLTLNGDQTRAKAIISRMYRYKSILIEGNDRRRA